MKKISVKNYIIRKGKFDAGHRVMHERYQCFNMHGHEYHYELKLSFKSAARIGYALDFKEIKRMACQWIDDKFDHGFICNPKDTIIVDACIAVGSKIYIMNLVDTEGFCNPSAENIAKELFFAVSQLLDDGNLKLEMLKLNETINCYVECTGLDEDEFVRLRHSKLYTDIQQFKLQRGRIEYDERK